LLVFRRYPVLIQAGTWNIMSEFLWVSSVPPRNFLDNSLNYTLPDMEVLLGLPPLHLQVEAEAMMGSYRLSCNEQWKPKSEGFGHAHMARDMEREPILQMGSDKIIPRHVYDKPFTIRFPDRSEWKKGFNLIEMGG
jgi:hypothetical protein